ncbi:hypothetical protein SOVF_000750, partial [Spinacia oleracea]
MPFTKIDYSHDFSKLYELHRFLLPLLTLASCFYNSYITTRYYLYSLGIFCKQSLVVLNKIIEFWGSPPGVWVVDGGIDDRPGCSFLRYRQDSNSGDGFVDVRMKLGGGFVESIYQGRKVVEYVGGWEYVKRQIRIHDCTLEKLMNRVSEGFSFANKPLPPGVKLWFTEKGKTLSSGMKELISEANISGFLQTRCILGILDVYVTNEPIPLTNPKGVTSYSTLPPKFQIRPLSQNSQKKPLLPKAKLETRRVPMVSIDCESLIFTTADFYNSPVREEILVVERRSTPRRKHMVVKGGGLKGKEVNKKAVKGKYKVKGKKQLFQDDKGEFGSSSSEFSDLDVNWVPGEEELQINGDDEELFFQINGGKTSAYDILKEVQASFGDEEQANTSAKPNANTKIVPDFAEEDITLPDFVEEDITLPDFAEEDISHLDFAEEDITLPDF